MPMPREDPPRFRCLTAVFRSMTSARRPGVQLSNAADALSSWFEVALASRLRTRLAAFSIEEGAWPRAC
jgi:hypothetical protein